jgi:hypothetical protein
MESDRPPVLQHRDIICREGEPTCKPIRNRTAIACMSAVGEAAKAEVNGANNEGRCIGGDSRVPSSVAGTRALSELPHGARPAAPRPPAMRTGTPLRTRAPSPRPYTPIGGPPPFETHGQHASGGEGTASGGGGGGGAELEWGVLVWRSFRGK